ncbi:zinc-dependent peptidase [Winogradskyella eckloniae]|uniref:zinc-dependent peptidase n=1 Tax=Winogradskyella eckloniae TaxID=1089306 RepID=UPI00156403DF|nr:zinc-dependent peptidase [Winogradskyella eckloniae]NRD19387.1 zinc-dependent peptidase [Winogradskyella eckloniae]
MLLQTEQENLERLFISRYMIPIGIAILVLFIIYRLFKIIQFLYATKFSKPLFTHLYLKRNELTAAQRSILKKEYAFYNKLKDRHQLHFEHRVAVFINENEFVGKEELIVTDCMKVIIAATATMLTFGFKKHRLNIIDTVIIYPKVYFSSINGVYHKGETNPQMKAIVFSWEDFNHGYKIGDDNLNLGIHEFGHAIHLNAKTSKDISSHIFNTGFNALITYLQSNENVRKNLLASKYFRTYAFTNHFEFFAVLLENFIETPDEFKSQFPELYRYMREMLNFRFAGY